MRLDLRRGVLVQGSAHGRDNSAMLDALARQPDRLRGVAVADTRICRPIARVERPRRPRAALQSFLPRRAVAHIAAACALMPARMLAPVMAELGGICNSGST